MTLASPGTSLEPKVYLRHLDGATEALGSAALAVPSPDGSEAALATPMGGGWRLTVCSKGGSKNIPRQNFNIVRQIAWEPDGSLLLSGSAGASGFRVLKMAVDGSGLQPVCPEGVSPDMPFQVSPDGRWLLVQAGPLLTRFDLHDPQALPSTLPGISPGERILRWGPDDGHVLVIRSRVPALTAVMSLADGSREPAFPIATYGHPGALVDQAISAQSGEGYAIGCRDTRSRLFMVSGIH